jgi:hypothetical protein
MAEGHQVIRAGDLTNRTARVVARVAEVGDKVRPSAHVDPLGLGLTYPVMFMAYDVERDVEVPLSGLMHEDDPNLVVVSLVAEAIAEESALSEGTTNNELVYIMEVWNS